jgi:hypothetical protein
MANVIGLVINFLPLLILLGLFGALGVWANRRVSLNFNTTTGWGRAQSWGLRFIVFIGTLWLAALIVGLALTALLALVD